MQQRYNVLSGVASSVVASISTIALVPIYLHYLGKEAYGVVGFYATMQSLMGVFDLGFSATITREMAQAYAIRQKCDASRMVRALTPLYWGIGIAIALIIVFFSAWLTDRWLNVRDLPKGQVSAAIALAGVSLGIRWPASIYQAVLLGSNRMVTCSLIAIATTFITTIGTVVLVIFFEADLRGLFAWHAASGLFLVMVMRAKAASALKSKAQNKFEFGQICIAWRLSKSMAIVGVIALVFLQMDKLIISRMLPLENFAHYMLATLIASAIYMLVMPIYNAAYPWLSSLTTKNEFQHLVSTYRKISWLLASLIFPMAMFLALNGRQLVYLWTSDAELATAVSPMLALLSVGSSLHGMTFMPHALALAFGASTLVLRINLMLLMAFGPLIVALTAWLGGVGAAWAWAILHGAYLVFGSIYTHRLLLPQVTSLWLFSDILITCAISLFVALSGLALTQLMGISPTMGLVFNGLAMLGSAGILIGCRRMLTNEVNTLNSVIN